MSRPPSEEEKDEEKSGPAIGASDESPAKRKASAEQAAAILNTPSSSLQGNLEGGSKRARPASEHVNQRSTQGSHISSYALFKELASNSFVGYTFMEGCKRMLDMVNLLIDRENSRELVALIMEKLEISVAVVALRRSTANKMREDAAFAPSVAREYNSLIASRHLSPHISEIRSGGATTIDFITSSMKAEEHFNISSIQSFRDCFLKIINRCEHVSIIERTFSSVQLGLQGGKIKGALEFLRKAEGILLNTKKSRKALDLGEFSQSLNISSKSRADRKIVLESITKNIINLFDVFALCDGYEKLEELDKENFVKKVISRHLASCFIAFPLIEEFCSGRDLHENPETALASATSGQDDASFSSLAAAPRASVIPLDDADPIFRYDQLEEQDDMLESMAPTLDALDEEEEFYLPKPKAQALATLGEEEELGASQSLAQEDDPSKQGASASESSFLELFEALLHSEIDKWSPISRERGYSLKQIEEKRSHIKELVTNVRFEDGFTSLEEGHKYAEPPRARALQNPRMLSIGEDSQASLGGRS